MLEARKKSIATELRVSVMHPMFGYDQWYESRISLNQLRNLSDEQRKTFLFKLFEEFPPQFKEYIHRIMNISFMRPSIDYHDIKKIQGIDLIMDGLGLNGKIVVRDGIISAVDNVSKRGEHGLADEELQKNTLDMYYNLRKGVVVPPHLVDNRKTNTSKMTITLETEIVDGLWYGFDSWAFSDIDKYLFRDIAFRSENLNPEDITRESRSALTADYDVCNRTRFITSALENIIIKKIIKQKLIEGIKVLLMKDVDQKVIQNFDALLKFYETGLVPLGLFNDNLTIWHPPIMKK